MRHLTVLVILHIAIAAVTLSMYAWLGLGGPNVVQHILAMFAEAQLWIIATWAGIARRQWWMRVGGVVIAIVWGLLTVLIAGSLSTDRLAYFIAYFAIRVVMVAGGLALYRAQVARSYSVRPAAVEIHDFQFTLKSIMFWVLVVGCVLGMKPLFEAFPRSVLTTAVTLSCSMGTAELIGSVLLLWAVLGRARIRWRVAVAVGLLPVVGLITPFHHGDNHFWYMQIGTTLSALLVCSSLLVARSCGYRFPAPGAETGGATTCNSADGLRCGLGEPY